MKKKLSRRRFLESGLKSSLAVGGVAASGFGTERPESVQKPAAPAIRVMQSPPGRSGFSSHQRELLRAAMDEIIPAGDGMPAASELQAVEYLDHLAEGNPQIKSELVGSLSALENLCQKTFKQSFSTLPRSKRLNALTQLEKSAKGDEFNALRDYVYEAYYTQPEVGKLIGYEFHATSESGPHMKPFDEAVLAKVRGKPKMYREK